VFVLGNGGSASTASHMAADLAKNTIGANMRRVRIMSLNDNIPLLTALGNDVGYHRVFAEQLMNLIQPGDVLVVISGSGNSPNVLRAIDYARAECAEVVGLLGFSGGRAAEQASELEKGKGTRRAARPVELVRIDHPGVVDQREAHALAYATLLANPRDQAVSMGYIGVFLRPGHSKELDISPTTVAAGMAVEVKGEDRRQQIFIIEPESPLRPSISFKLWPRPLMKCVSGLRSSSSSTSSCNTVITRRPRARPRPLPSSPEPQAARGTSGLPRTYGVTCARRGAIRWR